MQSSFQDLPVDTILDDDGIALQKIAEESFINGRRAMPLEAKEAQRDT